jgi:hypothetical protein
VSPRIGLGGTAEHADTRPDGSAGSRASAAANDAANDGSHCRALNSALHHLRRGKRARPNTGPNQGQADNGEYADGCHEIPPSKGLDLRAALKNGASARWNHNAPVAKVDVVPVSPTPAGTFSLIKNTSKILTACIPVPSRISLAPAALCHVHGHNADTSVMSLGPMGWFLPFPNRKLVISFCLFLPRRSWEAIDQDFFLPPEGTVFLGGLAQPSLDIGERVGKFDIGEGVLDFDIGHEQSALITFQPLDLEAKVVGHRFNSSPLGEMQLLPKSGLGHLPPQSNGNEL